MSLTHLAMLCNATLLLMCVFSASLSGCSWFTNIGVTAMCAFLIHDIPKYMKVLTGYSLSCAEPSRRLQSMLGRGFRGVSHTPMPLAMYNLHRALSVVLVVRLDHPLEKPLGLALSVAFLLQLWADALFAHFVATHPEMRKAIIDKYL